MNTPTITQEKVQINLTDEVMRFSLKVGTVVCALIGIWAMTCIIAGLTSAGPLATVQGYFTALTGL